MQTTLLIQKSKLWVLKIGGSILTDSEGHPDPKIFSILAREVDALLKQKKQVVIVSSGAIACGMHLMNLKKKPHLISQKQAIAAMGQIELMNLYRRAFAKQGLKIAQLLLTRADLANRERYLNARHATYELLNYGVVPIINENDTVAVDEIKFGDNDNLSALVTNVVEADLLLILTDQKGLYTQDPRLNPKAQKIEVLENIDDQIKSFAGSTQGSSTTGGMITKLEAAQKATLFGVPTLIASGKIKKPLTSLLQNLNSATCVLPKVSTERLSRRKHWIAYSLKSAGQIQIDLGATQVIAGQGKSLLASGIRAVLGTFEKGDAVEIVSEKGQVLAKGLVNYSSLELEKIKGCKSSEIEKKLGYQYSAEVIHRDDLVVI